MLNLRVNPEVSVFTLRDDIPFYQQKHKKAEAGKSTKEAWKL